MHAASHEGLQRLHAEPAIGHARRDDHGAGLQGCSARDGDAVQPAGPQLGAVHPPGLERLDGGACEEARPEPDGLHAGSLRQPHPRDAAREAEVVADHRAAPGLPADGVGLDDDGGEALAGAIHGRRQARRTGTDHGQVRHESLAHGVEPAVERPPHVRDGRIDDGLAPVRDDDREDGGLVALPSQAVEDRPALLGAVDDRAAGHAHPVEEVPDPCGARAVRLAHDGEHRHLGGRDRGAPVGEQVGDGRVELLVARPPRQHEIGVDGAALLRLAHGREVLRGVRTDEEHEALGRRQGLVQDPQGQERRAVGQIHLGRDQGHETLARRESLGHVEGLVQPGGEDEVVVGAVARCQLPLDVGAVRTADDQDGGAVAVLGRHGGQSAV